MFALSAIKIKIEYLCVIDDLLTEWARKRITNEMKILNRTGTPRSINNSILKRKGCRKFMIKILFQERTLELLRFLHFEVVIVRKKNEFLHPSEAPSLGHWICFTIIYPTQWRKMRRNVSIFFSSSKHSLTMLTKQLTILNIFDWI